MRTIIAYLRVSTREQGRSGLGLEAQRRTIEQFAAQNELTVLAWYEEVQTGNGSDALVRRPVLAEALRHAKRTRSTLLTSKLDRLARDVHFITGLRAQGVSFDNCEDGLDADPFVINIKAALAEKERQLISTRTKEALASARQRGVTLGNRTNPDAARAKAAQTLSDARRARNAPVLLILDDLRAQGITSYSALARALNDRRVPTPQGGDWYATSVRNVLT